MKTLLIILLTSFLFSNDYYKSYIKKLHPFPEAQNKIPDYLLSEPTPNASNFNNFNTIIEDIEVQNESSISVNPTNPNNLIAAAVDYRADGDRWVYYSNDGGKTWLNQNLGKANTWRSSNDPSVAYNTEGWGYLMYGAFVGSGGPNGIFISITKDEGETWDTHIPVIENLVIDEPTDPFEDKYYVEIDQSLESPYKDYVYTPWKRVTALDSATQIMFARSTDKGYTWDEPLPISPRKAGTSEDTTYGQSFPLLSTGKNGEIYAVWNDGIVHGVGFNRSYDGGLTWEEPKIIHNYEIFGETRLLNQGWRHSLKGVVRAEAYPVVKSDWTNSEHSGNLYVTWTADNPPNVYFSRSTDDGDNWSDPIIVHSETKGDQFWQWMDIDPINGDLGIMYLDSRSDENNIWVEAWISYSNDGGLTWQDAQVSDFTSDIRRNPFSGEFAGDYSGLAFYDGKMYPSWVDMRHTVAPLGSDNDVYTAIVDINAPSPVKSISGSNNKDNPFVLDIEWEPDFSSAYFGNQIDQEEISLNIYANGELLSNVTSENTSFQLDDLEPNTLYDISITEVYNGRESASRSIELIPGGSSEIEDPFFVSLTRIEGNDTKVNYTLPQYRIDQTEISIIKKVDVFVNGVLNNTVEENLSPGESIEIDLLGLEEGFYNISFSVLAGYKDYPEIESTSNPLSNFIFVGEIVENYDYDFDDNIPVHYKSENWNLDNMFALEGNYITNSINGKYQRNQEDTLILRPFNNGFEYNALSFDHSALIYFNDFAYVEVSPDLETWYLAGTYNENTREVWQDSNIDQNDWINENLDLSDYDWDEIYARFRFESNFLAESEGWFIDNININNLFTSVNELPNVFVYPNPTSSSIHLNLDGEYQILDIFGKVCKEGFYHQGNKLDVSNLTTGSYIIKFNQRSALFIKS